MSRNPETLARRLVDELGHVIDNQRAASPERLRIAKAISTARPVTAHRPIG